MRSSHGIIFIAQFYLLKRVVREIEGREEINVLSFVILKLVKKMPDRLNKNVRV